VARPGPVCAGTLDFLEPRGPRALIVARNGSDPLRNPHAGPAVWRYPGRGGQVQLQVLRKDFTHDKRSIVQMHLVHALPEFERKMACGSDSPRPWTGGHVRTAGDRGDSRLDIEQAKILAVGRSIHIQQHCIAWPPQRTEALAPVRCIREGYGSLAVTPTQLRAQRLNLRSLAWRLQSDPPAHSQDRGLLPSRPTGLPACTR